MENILDNLNSVQREAVEHTEGPTLIIAGAGSGKTRVLTCKIAYLLMRKINPRSILALTFTNKAAREMKERIEKVAGNQTGRLWIGTFHSIFSRILRVEAESIGFNSNFTIYDTTDSLSVVRSIIKELNLDDKIYKDKDVFNRISMAKNYLMTPAAYIASPQLTGEDAKMRKSRISDIYLKYFAKCRSANAMDFDDLLLYTNILFRDNPEILNKYQQIFRYILVDEYQDTNMAQYLIIKRLAETWRNITVVGDDAQSIYSFRGARIENILNFRKDYPDYSEYKLEQNYRSTKTIVNAANSLIEKNKTRLNKICFSEGEIGDRIGIFKAFTDQEEGLLVVNSIVETIYRQHVSCSQIAVLYRTNAQSRIFEDSLRRKNVPYRIYGGLSFYQRAEIKDALAYMRLAVNPQDDEALKRIINYPARGIGNTSFDRIQAYAPENNLSLWDTISDVPLTTIGIKDGIARKIADFRELINSFIAKANVESAYDFAVEVVKKSGIRAELKANKSPEGISKLENIEELLNGIKEYSARAENSDENITITEYLQNVSLITDADKESSDDRNRVSLMTIHSSKGLEFDYVYIVGVEEGLFPGNLTLLSEQSLEEERRLFYVALTRAAIRAHISYAGTRYRHGNLTSSTPSRFIRDIDKKYLTGQTSKYDVEFDAEPESPDESDETCSQTPVFRKKSEIDKQYFKPSAQSSDNSSAVSSDISAFRSGMNVEHARFGTGVIVEIEGSGSDKKARIDFQNSGKKTLLLKYAKLNIIG